MTRAQEIERVAQKIVQQASAGAGLTVGALLDLTQALALPDGGVKLETDGEAVAWLYKDFPSVSWQFYPDPERPPAYHLRVCEALFLRPDPRVRELREALTMLLDEKVEYMTINNLGNPETQHTVKAARAALATGEKDG